MFDILLIKVKRMTNIVQIKRKIVMVGDPAVGKTSLIKKFVLDVFSDQYLTTLGTKITSKKVTYPDNETDREFELTLMIWDIMGQKEYKLIHETAYQGSKGAILVCDLTRKESLHNLVNWITMLFNVTKALPIVIVANKNDLGDQIQFGDAELTEIALPYHAKFFKTSAKTGENVEKIFTELGAMMLREQGAFS
jgi:small GTP-binding protein